MALIIEEEEKEEASIAFFRFRVIGASPSLKTTTPFVAIKEENKWENRKGKKNGSKLCRIRQLLWRLYKTQLTEFLNDFTSTAIDTFADKVTNYFSMKNCSYIPIEKIFHFILGWLHHFFFFLNIIL